MKRFCAILFSLLLALPVWAAPIAVDQTSAKQYLASQGSTSDYTWDAAPTKGSFAAVCIKGFRSATTYDATGATDNQTGNTWTLYKSGVVDSTLKSQVIVATATIVGTGTPFVITIANAGVSNNGVEVSAVSFTGIAASSPVDQSKGNSARNTTTDANVTADAANAQANTLALACAQVDALDHSTGVASVNLGANATAGYTNISLEQSTLCCNAHSFDYKILSSVETTSANWSHDPATNDAADGWEAVLLTVKGADAGGDGAAPVRHRVVQQ